MIHAARLSKSPQLQRVFSFWSDGHWHSTMDTITHCNVCAVNAIASELRKNLVPVECERRGDVWWYRITQQREAA